MEEMHCCNEWEREVSVPLPHKVWLGSLHASQKVQGTSKGSTWTHRMLYLFRKQAINSKSHFCGCPIPPLKSTPLDSLDDQYEGSLSKSYQRYIYAYSGTQPFHFQGFRLHLTCLMMCERKCHYSKFLKWQKTENNPRTHQWQNWLNKLCYIHTIEFYVCRAKKEWGNTLWTATEISPRYIVKLKETRCGTVWRNSYYLYYKAGKKWRVSVHLDFLVCA